MADVIPTMPPLTAERRDRVIRRWQRLRRQAAAFVVSLDEVPPFSPGRLRVLADQLAASETPAVKDPVEKKLLAIMIHNEAWRATVAAVPFDRRLLLLPQCLRSRDRCPAGRDAYGLLCDACGLCPLGALQQEAEALGYAVLITEGTGAAIDLLREGRLDAVVGASCLPALEKTFARIAGAAVPALAIPLLRDGCDATDVDLDWLLEHIRLRVDAPAGGASSHQTPHVDGNGSDSCMRLSLDALRTRVGDWFDPAAIRQLLNPDDLSTLALAVDWLTRTGKRWRPLLTLVVYDALQPVPDVAGDALIYPVAVATECFHKASLIHDDIEDGDALRDGCPTLHRERGVAVALNVGDLLLGEGYGLLARCAAAADVRVDMLKRAADAHRRLCLGQGEELSFRQGAVEPDLEAIIRIFRHKTSPAFEVAILLGALAGGAGDETCAALSAFSDALGIAYQIRDDLLDWRQDAGVRHDQRQQLSIVLALLRTRCSPAERVRLRDALAGSMPGADRQAVLEALYVRHGVHATVLSMQRDYRERALQALSPLRSIRLKSALMRLFNQILPSV